MKQFTEAELRDLLDQAYDLGYIQSSQDHRTHQSRNSEDEQTTHIDTIMESV